MIGIGTRYSDFTTASRSAFQNPDVRFVNINVAGLDAIKHAGLSVQADARETLEALLPLLDGYRVDDAYGATYGELNAAWDDTVQHVYLPDAPTRSWRLPTQNEVIGSGQRAVRSRDVVVCVADRCRRPA